jgi:hypothetical protein
LETASSLTASKRTQSPGPKQTCPPIHPAKNPFSAARETGGRYDYTGKQARDTCGEGRTEPGRGASSAVLVGNDQEANPTARPGGSFEASVPPQHKGLSRCRLMHPRIPMRVVLTRRIKEKTDSNFTTPSGVPASALVLFWVAWAGLKSQARFLEGRA